MRGLLNYVSRTTLLQIVIAIVVGMIGSYVVISVQEPSKVQSKAGILDLTHVQVHDSSLKLQGEWEFYWHELLSPEDLAASVGQQQRFITLPNSWRGYQLDDEQLGSTGYATFRLAIQLGEQDRNERLALRLPAIFHAYKLWVNGELMAEVGTVGKDKGEMTPRLATRLVFFQPDSDTVELVVQVANYHHARGGITMYIELGGTDELSSRSNLKVASEMFITATLLVIGLYHLLLFLLRRKDRAPLFFGLFTLVFGIRSLFVGEHLITQLWPGIPWELQFKIEYLILCGGVYFIVQYFNEIYPNYVSRWFQWSSRISTSLLCFLVIATPAIVYTRLLPVIGVVVIFHILYLIIGLVVSAIRGREGAVLFLLVSIVVLVSVTNDFLYFSEWSPVANTSPLGLLVFTIAQMMLLSSRFTRAASNEERIARELQIANSQLIEMNTNLERIVQERTRALSAANEELRKSYDQLLLSEQGRKKVLAYITHDLRLPLSSMLGYVEAVQDGVRPERHDQYLKYIRDNTIRVNRMIEELSFLSHLETGQVSYLMEPVNAVQFLRRFYNQYELVVRDAGLSFNLDVDDITQPVSVVMDPLRLEQALFNLVSNAMKFTSSGGEVRLALAVEERNDTRSAVISVHDTGMGIPPDQLEQIFDRNYRSDRPDVEGIEGSGLGLAICREIVQAHGGTVHAESDGRTGSIFYVALPCLMEDTP